MLCQNLLRALRIRISDMLKPLVTEKLAVGPSHDWGGLSLTDLKKEGITAVVDLNQERKEANEASKIGLVYVADSKLRIPDDFEPIPIYTLRYAAAKIHQLVSQGHYVYLHCSASFGRSPTIAAAYLIYQGKEMNEAMNMVKSVQLNAWHGENMKFAALLGEFEKTYRENCFSK